MVDLTLTEGQKRIKEELAPLAVERLRPLAADAEAKSSFPKSATSILSAIEWLPGNDAFVSGTADPLSFCLAAEGLGWADPALAFSWTTSRQVAWLIGACGTPEQKAKYLPALAGSPLAPASLLLFEGYGRAPSELDTTARRVGEEWVITGEKTAVGFAGDGGPAVIIARDEDGALVGFVVDRLDGAVTFHGAGERRLALGASHLASTAEVAGLRVGGDALLRRDGLVAAVSVCRLALASLSLGIADSATRYASDWAVNRTAFGRPLVGFQGVAFVLANLLMESEAVRMSLDHAFTNLDDAVGEELTSRAVADANHLYRNAAREGIELMGVHGVITDHPVERIYRSAGVLTAIDFDPLLSLLVLSNS